MFGGSNSTIKVTHHKPRHVARRYWFAAECSKNSASLHRGADDTQPEAFCHADKLAVPPSAKYLGVILEEELSWKPQIAHLSHKTARTIGQLWRHGQGLSLRARRTWFLSMVLSHGSNSFVTGLSAQLLGRLEKSFKAGIRATLQQRFLTPTAPFLALLSIVSLAHTYTQKVLIFVHRCINGYCSPLLQQLFTTTAPNTVLNDQLITRGQVPNYLQVPFLRGPAGRSSMMFHGSIAWNALSADVRSITAADQFKRARSDIDLLNL